MSRFTGPPVMVAFITMFKPHELLLYIAVCVGGTIALVLIFRAQPRAFSVSLSPGTPRFVKIFATIDSVKKAAWTAVF